MFLKSETKKKLKIGTNNFSLLYYFSVDFVFGITHVPGILRSFNAFSFDLEITNLGTIV